MATWATSLPQKPEIDGYVVTYEPATREFRPDLGPPLRRSAASTSYKVWDGIYWFTEAQLSAFWTFYNTTINKGVDQFNITDPNTDSTVTVEFADATVPEARMIGHNLYEIRLRFRVRA